MRDEPLAAPPPSRASTGPGSGAVQTGSARAPAPPGARMRQAMRHPHNWTQLVRFCAVGGLGYVVNLGVFYVLAEELDVHHLAAATTAFLVAVTNNFFFNRYWTFQAGAGRARSQAVRYIAVNVTSLAFQLAVLEVLVSVVGSPKVLAQAISVAAQVPLNFAGNKMWTFGLRAPEG